MTVRNLFYVGGILFALAVLLMWIGGIWVNDGRWGITGMLLIFPSMACFFAGSYVKHDERCTGC